MASSSARVTATDMERNPEKKKKKGVRASFKKGWRAVKGCCSCTQSNDLDPSEEPYLPVLNPVVLADTADRPGCDLEQTPLEDAVDPPQDPSGLKQTAPEEPTDNTAEQQTEGKKKKKGVCAPFKKGWQAMKHSCARNNKVVPLPTQSDLDPSSSAPVDPQPAPVDPQPAPEDPSEDRPEGKKKKKGVRARFKKGWQAMKHSCARNNKVVPLPTQSDLDPSSSAPVDPQPAREDPQPAPVDPQPAPVDPHPAPVDPQPAPLDPQPAPVDPLPAPVDSQPAPEDPPEDRPEGKKKKKNGVRARFKKGWQAMKHSCARNKKVVPLPTQSDLDPSSSAPVDPQPAPVDPQPAPVDPQPAPVDPQPAHEDSQSEDEDWESREEQAEFNRALSDFDPYVQNILLNCEPDWPLEFPAPWYTDQLFLHELEKFEAFSALYKVRKTCLGKGHHGIVYAGTRKSDGLKVAIKFIYKSSNCDRFIHVPGYDKPLYSEVALNLMLQKPERCPNIVALLDWFEEDIIYILVLEYPYPCVSMEDFLDAVYPSEDQARPLMRQAVNAAQHCIEHDVCHGSLSVRNTVINIQSMTLMFIDFGRGHLASTWGKPDPEHSDTEDDSPASTWFEPGGESWGRGHAVADMVSSLGKLLLCILGGFWATLEDDSVTKESPELTELGLTEECLDLIIRSGIASPDNRPTLEEFLDHEWFKQG